MLEFVVRGEEHESAWSSHCYSDDTSIELDGKTLRSHNLSPGERPNARRSHWQAQLQAARLLKILGKRPLQSEARFMRRRPQARPA
jgi:hypothetical protein